MLPGAIRAGGLATRLRPTTERVPKALIEVAGRPFICWQLDYLSKQRVTRVVVCVGHLGELIERAIGAGSSFGLKTEYAFDGPRLLGTGGALRRALPILGDAFFGLYGDSYLPIAFDSVQAAFERSGRPALMTLIRNDNQWDKSNVRFEGGAI